MPHLAVYGTLRDPDIIRTVLGRDPSPWARGTTQLPHWSSYYVEGAVYPGLKREPTAQLQLQLYQNIPMDCWEKLLTYEAAEYKQVGIKFRGVTYTLFVPSQRTPLSPSKWSLESFQAEHKTGFMMGLSGETLVLGA
ncbi:MAG: hypothetical protein M3Q07_27435 [Pseudobdellovibrionaceae bacterium]|nr:hypothetical protein [Pseudobdellovibrionaceae bacterium]